MTISSLRRSEAPRAKARGFHSSGANPAPSIPALKNGALGRRGKEEIPCKVKLITGLLYKDAGTFEKAKGRLIRFFGKTDLESAELEFTHTRYYEDEMGPGLKRRFLSFERPANLDGIYRAKIITNSIEKMFSVSGKREININGNYRSCDTAIRQQQDTLQLGPR